MPDKPSTLLQELGPNRRLLLRTLSPRLASLVQWWEERQRIKQQRYLDLIDLAEAHRVGQIDELLRRSAVDENLGDFVEALIDLATQTSSRRKSEAFGRLLALTAADVEHEPLDEAWLLLNAVADLDPPHLKVLRRLDRDGDRYRGIVDLELAAMFPNGTTVLYPILKTLERHGLAGPLRPARSGDPDGPVEWAIWDFGLLLLGRLYPNRASDL
ncbi:MAG TPA: hypothetical protein VFU94_10220 [Conexibacter sp.]|nr:hypothetical protein [Conexibacter sp.]